MAKTWLITGCSAGLGRTLAEELAPLGAQEIGVEPRPCRTEFLDAFHADIAAWRDAAIATDFEGHAPQGWR
jgi:NAD(P)-dependent dehydrogenase (short-subunit alcohol dehydrogenase family)